jgi:hypothetical protein
MTSTPCGSTMVRMDVGIDTTGIVVFIGMVVVALGLSLLAMRRPRPTSPAPLRARRWAVVDAIGLAFFIALPLTGDIWLRLLIGVAAAGTLFGIGEVLGWRRRTHRHTAR